MILWIWRHRHCWGDIKELWEHLYEIKHIMLKLHMESLIPQWKDETKVELIEEGQKCWEWLRYCGALKPSRPWMEPPNRPKPKTEEDE